MNQVSADHVVQLADLLTQGRKLAGSHLRASKMKHGLRDLNPSCPGTAGWHVLDAEWSQQAAYGGQPTCCSARVGENRPSLGKRVAEPLEMVKVGHAAILSPFEPGGAPIGSHNRLLSRALMP